MPPTFVYMMALLVWVPIACLVWLVAAIMALRKASRQTARSCFTASSGPSTCNRTWYAASPSGQTVFSICAVRATSAATADGYR